MWLIWIAALMALPTGLPAMELKVVGNQLIVSGRVVGDEPAVTIDWWGASNYARG